MGFKKWKKVTPEQLNERLLNIAEEDLRRFIESSLTIASVTYQSVLGGEVDREAGLQFALENVQYSAQGIIVYLHRLEERHGS
jgi:hypothetical protein